MTPPLRQLRMPTNPDWATLASRLRRFALALTRSPNDADDLMQRTLLALLAKQPERIGHWGYARQTLTRLWLDEQRSLRRRLRRLTDLAGRVALWHAPPDAVSADEQLRRVRNAIRALPPLQQAVVVLRLVEELDYAEIAATLESSMENVRASLHLARQRLRETVGDVL